VPRVRLRLAYNSGAKIDYAKSFTIAHLSKLRSVFHTSVDFALTSTTTYPLPMHPFRICHRSHETRGKPISTRNTSR
jgi:hypothetical protein